MGEVEDVICLSSDDENLQDEIQQKKLTGKLSPKEKEKDTIVCSLKRKNSNYGVSTNSDMMKKMKIDNRDTDKATIDNKVKNIFSGALKKVSEISKNGEMSISKIVKKKSLVLTKHANGTNSSNSRASNGNSNEFNGKTVVAGKSRNLEENTKNSNTNENMGIVETSENREKLLKIIDVTKAKEKNLILKTINGKTDKIMNCGDDEENSSGKKINDKTTIHESVVTSNSEENMENNDEKTPLLVVINKEPVFHQEYNDTFSMFLSLCLQTDRCSDMEKVVEKLKRYYEQMNPAYASSQAFQDTLNEKRELILRKGRKFVYRYVESLKKDMKAKRKMVLNDSAPKNQDMQDNEQDNDDKINEETKRHSEKIKRIEKAMKECQKKIKKYEEAEVDFEDDNNSHYIKLNRFKERMVELYNQMCKYTNESPDAGRAYLRPKNLRVTQIPSIDQAINSFINSKLSVDKRNITKSCVDGLIFPDYVDILECVDKVNKEKILNLNKRDMQQLAEKAFTQMGKHLQEARQNDYWDTFSLNLDSNIDPASADTELSNKLSENQKIADINVKKVFEEFVRKQEEGNNDSVSEGEEDEDEEDPEADDDDDNNNVDVDDDDDDDGDKCSGDGGDVNDEGEGHDSVEEKSVNGDSDVEISIDKDIDGEIKKMDEAPTNKDGDCTANDKVKNISNNNASSVLQMNSSPKKQEVKSIEVITVNFDTEDVEEEAVPPVAEEETGHPPLRIRSFAKPPESWQCSQEGNKEKNPVDKDVTIDEKSENADDEISVLSSYIPNRNVVTKNVTAINGKINDIVSSNTGYNKIIAQKVIKRPLSRVENNVQCTKKKLLESKAKKIVSSLSKGIRQEVSVSVRSNFDLGKEMKMRFRMPAATSTPVQLPPQSSPKKISTVLPQEQNNPVKLLRLSNGKIVVTNNALKTPKAPRFITIATTSTPIQTVPLQSSTEQMSINSIANTQNSTESTVVTPQLKKRVAAVHLTAARHRSMQILRLNNGKIYPTQIVSSSSDKPQVSRKPPPVLKLRITDNNQTVQHYRPIAPKVTVPHHDNQNISGN